MLAWLKKFNRKMKTEERKVTLFLNNAASHPKIDLENVKLVFLFPSTTSHCQIMDQGIIKNFKVIYRGMLVKRTLTLIDTE